MIRLVAFDSVGSRLRVLEFLRRHEPTSHTALCLGTGLGNATVSGIVREMMANGFLREARSNADGRGRPRVMLRTDAETHLVAGAILYLEDNRVEFQICNLAGDVLLQSDETLPGHTATLPALTDAISRMLAHALQREDFAGRTPALLGICLPAMVDAHKGVVHWLPPEAPQRYPMAEILGARFGIPVFLDNYCNVVARAERWFGETAFSDDLCVIFVGAGVGLAQYIGGSLHRGSHGLNSEFSHIKTGVGADLECGCGARGCLVQSAGFVSLAGVARKLFDLDIDPLRDFDMAFGEIAHRASQGNPLAIDLCDRAARALGVAIANHIVLWDPSRIMVVTLHPDWTAAIGKQMLGYIGQNLPDAMAEMASVSIRFEPEVLAKKGVVALAIDEMMNANDLKTWKAG